MKSRSTLKRITLSAAIAAGFLSVSAATSNGQTVGNWIAPPFTPPAISTGNWSDPANWSSNPAIPSLAGDTAQYAGTDTTITVVDTPQTVGTISLGGSSDIYWQITPTTSLTFDQDGAGPGFATFSNTNPNTGTTNQMYTAAAGAGASIILADDLHLINSSASTVNYAVWINTVMTGAGNLTFRNDSNNLTNGIIRLSGNNTFVGNSLIQKGTAGFGNANAFGPSATNSITLGDATGGGQGSATLLATAAVTISNPITVAAGSGGTLTLGGNVNSATAHGYSGTITLDDNVNLVSSDLGANNVLFSGAISGVGGVTLPATNTGNIRLSSTASTYSGGTTLNAGTLTIGANSSPAVGSPVVSGPLGTGTLTLSGGTLSWNGGSSITAGTTAAFIANVANPIFVTPNTTTNMNGTVGNRYLNLNGPITGSGTIRVNSGTISGSTLYISSDISDFQGTFDFSSDINNSTTLSFANGQPTAVFDGSKAKFIVNQNGGNRPFRFGGVASAANGSPASTDATLKMGELSGTTATGNIFGDATNINYLEVGALNTDSSFAGYLRSRIALRKMGTGSFTLTNTTATHVYAKGTTVSGGTLIAGGDALLTGGVFGVPEVSPNDFTTIQINDNAVDGTNVTNANTGLLINGAFTVGMPIKVNNFGTGTTTIGGNADANSIFSGAITLDKSADLTSVATLANAVTLSGPVSGVGGLNKVGTGIAMLTGTNTYTGNTTVSAGTLTIEGTQSTSGNYTVDNPSGGATLNINNSLTTSGNLTIGEGTVHVFDNSTLADFQNVNNATGNGTLVVWANSAMISNNVRADVYEVNGTATVRANGGTAGASKVETLNIGLAGKLNLKDNDLVVGGAGSVDPIRAEIILGKANNASFGITSDMPAFGTTTGFGYALGSDAALSPLLAGSLTGQTYDANSVLVKYTFLGDADLDGDSDLNDLGLWAQSFTGDLGNPANPATYWTSGDFDYDGDTDLNDLGFWAGTFTGDLGGGAGSLIVVAPGAPAGAVAALNSMGITVVPEPSTFVLAGVGLAGLALLRKRKVK